MPIISIDGAIFSSAEDANRFLEKVRSNRMTNEIATTDARVNITWDGQNGDLSSPVYFESPDGDLKSWAQEAVQNGDVPGIAADNQVDFSDYVVDRFAATADRPWNQINIRPKTPFGA